MKQDLFRHLPSEIITNILSRLPVRTIAISKCVCKPWLNLLETIEFADSHLAKSIPCLVVLTRDRYDREPSSCTIFEFEDGDDLPHHDLHYNQLIKLDFPHSVAIGGCANCLLFLFNLSDKSESHYVCNPITRDYIKVEFPKELIRPYPKVMSYPEILEESVYSYPHSVAYGFGASKITGQYKVVRIFHDSVIARSGRRNIPESECYVFTLGSGSWRRIEPGAPFEYGPRGSCVFLNGNLHWIVSDSESKLWISCFDIERERFSAFSTPPLHQEGFELPAGLSVLEDCLCLCDHTREDETVIWMMKEYGVETSWTKEYDFSINPDLDIEGFELIYPIKVFKDGDILMLREDMQLFYYSNKTQTAGEIDLFKPHDTINSIILTPSFLSLRSLGIQNVISF